MNKVKIIALSVVVGLGLVACSNSDVDADSVKAETTPAKVAPDTSAEPAPKYDATVSTPGSPFSVSYKVIGTPIVGSPVTVDLKVMSALGSDPVKVNYRINDASAMMFHEAQPMEVVMAPAANEDFISQQITVIPQREGRLYLNVAASVATDDGSMSSMMAIPIQVGGGGRELEENGEVQLDEDGEAIRVLSND